MKKLFATAIIVLTFTGISNAQMPMRLGGSGMIAIPTSGDAGFGFLGKFEMVMGYNFRMTFTSGYISPGELIPFWLGGKFGITRGFYGQGELGFTVYSGGSDFGFGAGLGYEYGLSRSAYVDMGLKYNYIGSDAGLFGIHFGVMFKL